MIMPKIKMGSGTSDKQDAVSIIEEHLKILKMPREKLAKKIADEVYELLMSDEGYDYIKSIIILMLSASLTNAVEPDEKENQAVLGMFR